MNLLNMIVMVALRLNMVVLIASIVIHAIKWLDKRAGLVKDIRESKHDGFSSSKATQQSFDRFCVPQLFKYSE
jgi:hypothetical protein